MAKRKAGFQEIRPARTAEDDKRLKIDPGDPDAKLDIELDESFPASDPPSQTQPEQDWRKAIKR
ncbi:hypothetical protein [Sphingosinicella soli]|uniref:Uncharacterized protein n=1 Tax=Sphingosinicella soli TaxID=333708 RepID=A0A7W7B3C5_9SPHN|nr:hypothetical protein [Sphingosinicella soli]MBB4633264.1 hypothetical protein [Sphingosinicella soli]